MMNSATHYNELKLLPAGQYWLPIGVILSLSVLCNALTAADNSSIPMMQQKKLTQTVKTRYLLLFTLSKTLISNYTKQSIYVEHVQMISLFQRE